MPYTLEQTYQTLRTQLASVTQSAEQASLEAILLLESILGITATEVYTHGDRRVSDEQTAQLTQLLEQRIHKRIPVQYLLHRAWFYGRSFYVNPAVLIPRPETELLLEQALKAFYALQSEHPQRTLSLLDVGTGPGTLALSLWLETRENKTAAPLVTAVDLSKEALQVARLNQRFLKTDVRLLPAGDLFAPVAGERFDIIVSNPPYIDPELKPTLTPEVLWHEPSEALFPPNTDALHFYRRLATEGKACLNPGGILLVEVGEGMAEAVQEIFIVNGFTNAVILADYAAVQRIVSVTM